MWAKTSLAFVLAVTLSMMAGSPGQSLADHPPVQPRECTATIAHLVGEMAAGRAYVQFHTDDGVDPKNTGPGDLDSPGEIRGDIAQGGHGTFSASADASQNVFGDGADSSPWAGVTATADLAFTANASGHHPSVDFSITASGLRNVTGIHVHNGAPGEKNSLRLVDLLTGSSSLIPGVSGGPIASMEGTYAGTIMAADVCPSDHAHGPAVAAPTIISPSDSSKVTPTPAIRGTAGPGVFVEVFSGTDSIGTAVSSSSGAWILQAAAPLAGGAHILTATATDGFGNSSAASPGVTVTVIEALGSVSGTVFVDSNGNGAPDAGEPGVETTVLVIYYEEPEAATLAITGPDGGFSFTGLIPGSYLVQITIPNGYVTPPGHDYFNRPTVSADAPATADFPLQRADPSTAPAVGGTAFSDANGNGVQDAGEPGVGGIAVMAIDLLTGEVTRTTTDGSGAYSITGLLPGVNLVQVGALPVGYLMAGGFDFFTYETLAASSSATVDFPLDEITADEAASLAGIIHEDDNGNGLHDPGEAGFPRVQVSLYELSSGRLLTTETNWRGVYEFAGVMPDMVLVQTGLIPADHLPQAGHSTFAYERLHAGKQSTLDFPMRHIHAGDTATVSGTVYHDANINGVRESGEPGLPGVTVTVTSLTTGQQEAGSTDAGGNFTIAGVMPDNVLIQSAIPGGFAPSTSNGGFEYHSLHGGHEKTVMFGFQGTAHAAHGGH